MIDQLYITADNRFQWHIRKARTNILDHDVSFEEACTVFDDPLSSTYPDDLHSRDEDRYLKIGQSYYGHILLVVAHDRGERIHLISARKATRREIRTYENTF